MQNEYKDNVVNIKEYRKLQKQMLKVQFNNFAATDLANYIIEEEKEQGSNWIYVAEDSELWNYNQNRGYWKITEKDYLLSKIRNYLIEVNKSWDTSHKVKEVFKAMKSILTDEENYKLMNVSKNKNLDVINLKNGMFNLKNQTLEEHSYDNYSQIQIPVEYNPDAKCNKWIQALKDWVPSSNTRKFLQEFIGYCLVPDNSQQLALMFLGNGSNGKSKFLEVISEIFGMENLSSIPLAKLQNKFEIRYVEDKLVNVCSDIDPTQLESTGQIKSLIHGDTSRAEIKQGKGYDFQPITRFMFSANELPRARDKSEGWYRSFEIIEFPNSFKKTDKNYDPYIFEKLVKELPGILNWAIEGLLRYRKNKKFTDSLDFEKQKIEYKKNNDTIAAFVLEHIEKTSNKEDKIISSKLYEEYKAYCEVESLKPQSRRVFTRGLEKEGIESKSAYIKSENKNYRCYLGIEYIKQIN